MAKKSELNVREGFIQQRKHVEGATDDINVVVKCATQQREQQTRGSIFHHGNVKKPT